MKIIVSGASGYIGRHLVNALAKAGHEVLALVRKKEDEALFKNPNIRAWHMDADGKWSAACLGASMFIHAAGRAHRKNPEGLDPQTLFRRDNVQLSMLAARVAVDMRIPSFVLMSSIGAKLLKEQETKGLVTRKTAWQTEPYRASKLEVEEGLADYFAKSGRATNLLTVRLPMVYGPDAPGNFSLLVKLVGTGLPLPFASIHNRRAFLSTANLDSFFVHLAERGHWPAGTWEIRDADEVSTPAFVQAIAEDYLHCKTRLLPFPPSLLAVAGRMAGLGASMESLLGSLSLDLSAVHCDLDWMPPYTVAESLSLLAPDKFGDQGR